jgi:hypothetical protein
MFAAADCAAVRAQSCAPAEAALCGQNLTVRLYVFDGYYKQV